MELALPNSIGIARSAIVLHFGAVGLALRVAFSLAATMRNSSNPAVGGTGKAGSPGLFAYAIAALVALTALAALLGWVLEIPFLKSVGSGWVSMKPNTALGLIVCSGGFALLARLKPSSMARRIAGVFGIAAMLLGTLTMTQYFFGFDLGIDNLFFRDTPVALETSHAGRMAPASALCFFLTGCALMMAAAPTPRRFRIPVLQALGVAVAIVGMFAVAGYIADLFLRFRIWSYTGMAMHTAVCFVLLGAAIEAIARLERPPAWALNRGTTFGFLAGILLILGAVNISFQFIGNMHRTAESVGHRQEILKEIQEIDTGLANLASNQRGYIITGDEHLLADRTATIDAVRQNVREIRELTTDNSHQQELLAKLEQLVAARLEWENTTISVRRDQGLTAAAQMVTTGTGQSLWKSLHDVLNEMRNEEYTVNYLLLPTGVFVSLTILLLCVSFLNFGTHERRQAELSLQESEQRYRELVEMSPNAIFINLDNRITFINGAGLRLLRAQDISQVVDRSPLDFFHPDCHAMIKKRVARLLEEPHTVPSAEEKLITVDGKIVPVEVTAVSYKERGRLTIQVVCTDITARKQAEEKLQLMHTELEQRVVQRTAELRNANKELDSFCYAVSHDLRAPLRGIAGFTRILSEGYGDTLDAQARGYFDRVIAATDRMGELIDDLLNLSRVSRDDIHRELVDLSVIARQIEHDLRHHSPERHVDFVIADGMAAEGDPRLLRIMLENLLGNAWKFTSKKSAARIEFSSHVDGTDTEFCIRDNGAGFDMRYAGRLFGPFQRLHGMKEFPGTGIGLATVQRIIHRHGGHIQAQASVDEGATFTFTI
jgi:PAS domain S-box-containing protein